MKMPIVSIATGMLDTIEEIRKDREMKNKSLGLFFLYFAAFIAAGIATAAILALLFNIQDRKEEAFQYPLKVVEIPEGEINPEVWGRNFPMEYDLFVKTELDYGETEYGGSTPYSKLERYPAMKEIWAGYSFAVDHNEERGHYYAAIDQANTQRTKIVEQPGACVNCHAAEVPALIEEMGWNEFNRTPYNELKPRLMTGSSCADCHDPVTMDLRITRPAFINAMSARGIDLEKATRQEMRTYVCAQCHVEYYFKGEDKLLTFPWSKGLNIDNIDEYYEEIAFADWTHKETGAPMLKMQHPEFEMWSSSIHARSGVACADCHMPYIRNGSVKVSDHWIRSPLTHVNESCQTCHKWEEKELEERVLEIQHKTAALLRSSEEALVEAIAAIKDARDNGVPDEDLANAMKLQRRASLRWDFVSSENSTGFHSPQEAARILGDSMNLARQAQIAALLAER